MEGGAGMAAVAADLHPGEVEAILLAKTKGLLDSLTQAIDEIEQIAGFYVDDVIKDRMLRAAGERGLPPTV